MYYLDIFIIKKELEINMNLTLTRIENNDPSKPC